MYRLNPDDEDRLLKQLRVLETEYWDNPPFLRKQDLKLINELREQLELPLVDNLLKEIEPEEDVIDEEEFEELPPSPPDPHAMAREIYEEYLEKQQKLRPHREYANRLIRATASNRDGMTPVMPLAKMGTGGGPLLCDECHKQFPLEGGRYSFKKAGEAWRRETQRLGHEPQNWYSFIYGHVTFMIVDNGTFRAYHGYESSGCGGKASQRMEEEQKEFLRSGEGKVPPGFRKAMHEYLQDEHGMFGMKQQRDDLIQKIIYELFRYDPGIGINRP